MKLSEVKEKLQQLEDLNFQLPGGNHIPRHFHVSEIGAINKHFIDCGGVVRTENKISFQLWEAGDLNHRLEADKLRKIIALSQSVLDLDDVEVEVEYQGDTIEKYGLSFEGGNFKLTTTHTDCLANDLCGPTDNSTKKNLKNIESSICCGTKFACC